jgi:hypothetical protein
MNTHKRAASNPNKKDMMQIVSDDAVARQRRVCKFVAGRIP